MIQKLVKAIMIIMIAVGIIIGIGNIISINLDAGQITKFGQDDPEDEFCPGIPSNCVVVYYVPDNG